MLSSCILLSLSLTACGQAGTDHAPAAQSSAIIPVVEEQVAQEEAFIVATEPVLDEKPQHVSQPSMLASASTAGSVQDAFGNLLPAGTAASGTAAGDATGTTDDSDLSGKHPRPTPWVPAGTPANVPNTAAPVYNATGGAQQTAGAGTSAGTGAAASTGTTTTPAAPGISIASSPSDSSQGSTPERGGPRLVPAGRNYALNSPEMARLYGPGLFTQTALANTIVGAPRNMETMVSNRFLSMVGGQLASVRLYWQAGSGYALGTGGTIRLSIHPDDGSDRNLPDLNAEPLATGTYKPALTPNDKRSLFTLIQMEHKGPALESGKLYHLVLQNIDPRPQENYISSNNATTYPRTGRPNRWLNTRDWSTLLAQRQQGTKLPFKWSNLTETGTTGNHFSPILQLNMKDGRSQGVGDMEGGHVDPKLIYTMTSSKPVRERFTPSSDEVISGISIATDASVAGSLRWRFMQGNTELASGVINAQTADYQIVQVKSGVQAAALRWRDIELPVGREVRMQAGKTYDLELQPQGNSEWKIGDHRNGSSYGFTWPAAFTESQAQHRHNGNWINVYHWDYSRSSNGSNWPIVLHRAP